MTIMQLMRSDKVIPDSNQETSMGYLASKQGVLPLCALDYECSIRSLGVETRVLQTFYNPFDVAIEATYVFPLNGTVAVTDCIMLVEDRVIRADLEERSNARKRYRQALRNGQRAALLEENRSETFSLSVGNIPAGETVRICLSTVGEIELANEEWMLRLPLVVAPRYTSGFPVPELRRKNPPNNRDVRRGVSGNTDEVPDAAHVTPARIVKGFPNPVELGLSVNIDLGSTRPIGEWDEILSSSLHTVIVERKDEQCRVSIPPGERVDRDFILRGTLHRPEVAVTTRMSAAAKDGKRTFAVHVVPPYVESVQEPKSVVFVLDKSGSMAGWKFAAAQRATCQLIESLDDKDAFGVMTFNTLAQQFQFASHTKTGPANAKNRFEATKWLSRQSVDGGTEMAQALSASLDMLLHSHVKTTASSIVLVTDGQITGEDFVLSQLKRFPKSERPRIYTVGVDRAVNASILRRLSESTGGTFELVESESQLDRSFESLSAAINGPVISGVSLNSDAEQELDVAVERTSLFKGRPLTLYGRTAKNRLDLTLKGKGGEGSEWVEQVIVAASKDAEDHSDLLPMWGKARVRNLEDEYAINNRDDEELRNEIIRTSLATRVLSRFTAYVAVDEEVVNDTGDALRVDQLVEFPEGWRQCVWAPVPIEERLSVASTNASGSAQVSRKSDYVNIPDNAVNQIGKRLVKAGRISQQQWDEAETVGANASENALSVLVCHFEIVDVSTMTRLISEVGKKVHIDSSLNEVPEDVVELMPETVARENCVIPIGVDGDKLVVAMASPWEFDTVENLRFILNCEIEVAVASGSQIIDMINENYGQFEGETADSMLQEFTDVQIDFTDVPAGMASRELGTVAGGHEYSDIECKMLLPVDLPDHLAVDAELSKPSKSNQSKSKTKSGQNGLGPIHRLLQIIVGEALKLGATEIHFYRGNLIRGIQVVFVIDGKSVDRDRIPNRFWSGLARVIREGMGESNNVHQSFSGEMKLDGGLINGVGVVDYSPKEISIRITGVDEQVE